MTHLLCAYDSTLAGLKKALEKHESIISVQFISSAIHPIVKVLFANAVSPQLASDAHKAFSVAPGTFETWSGLLLCCE